MRRRFFVNMTLILGLVLGIIYAQTMPLAKKAPSRLIRISKCSKKVLIASKHNRAMIRRMKKQQRAMKKQMEKIKKMIRQIKAQKKLRRR